MDFQQMSNTTEFVVEDRRVFRILTEFEGQVGSQGGKRRNFMLSDQDGKLCSFSISVSEEISQISPNIVDDLPSIGRRVIKQFLSGNKQGWMEIQPNSWSFDVLGE